jgi:hypothetical protein
VTFAIVVIHLVALLALALLPIDIRP